MSDQQSLICGARKHPDGSILIPYALAGPDRNELCKNPARYRAGMAETSIEEHLTTDPDTLAVEVEEREHAQNALYCCGVHTERAKEAWRHREQAPGSTDYPLITE